MPHEPSVLYQTEPALSAADRQELQMRDERLGAVGLAQM